MQTDLNAIQKKIRSAFRFETVFFCVLILLVKILEFPKVYMHFFCHGDIHGIEKLSQKPKLCKNKCIVYAPEKEIAGASSVGGV